MKRSQFVAGLIVVVLAQIGIHVVSQKWEEEKPDRSLTAVEVADAADAAVVRVLARALVAEQPPDPDYLIRDRRRPQARLKAAEKFRQARDGPEHVKPRRAKHDNLTRMQATAPTTTGRRSNQPPRERVARRQFESRSHTGPRAPEETDLQRELARQTVPRYLSGLDEPFDYSAALQEGDPTDTF